ncbi:hypothetical protein ACJ6YJ_32290 [Pseudomonas marginalis]|uniref:hypothetical protein n=1 Tax=Pseudomonas TaxID=286 RepID=UPI00389ACDE1
MPKLQSVYPRGHFFQQMAGAHQVDAAAMVSTRGFFGLYPSATFLYGCMRTDDGEMFEICRRVSHHGEGVATGIATDDSALSKPPAVLLVMSTEVDGEQLRFDLNSMQLQATTDDCEISLEGKDAVWKSAAGASGRPFRITFNESSCSWHEEGLFSLSGPILKPGLHWYLPGRDYGTYYVSQIFELKGEIKGRPCEGMIAFDQTYMGQGGNLYKNKDLVMEHQGHNVWYTWSTRYEDGSYECGHFMLGNGPLGFAVFTDGEQVVATRDITGFVTPREGSPFAERIDFVIDGEKWEFTPDPRGAMPDMMRKHPPTPQQEGFMRRVGETRKPIVWFAWGETEEEHGLSPQDRLPIEPIFA